MPSDRTITFRNTLAAGLGIALLLGSTGAALAKGPSKKTGVVINRAELSKRQLDRLEGSIGVRVPPGRYWYDRGCGAWGHQGAGSAGFLPAGLKVGGKLRANASNGSTGVFINGRQLHRTDVIGLMQLGVPVMQGRFWLDGQGNGGFEGQPASFDLLAMISASRAALRRNKGSVLSTYDKTGVAVY